MGGEMNCPNCDCYTPDDSPVCIHCGAQLPEVSASRNQAGHYGGTSASARHVGGRGAAGGGKGIFIVVWGIILIAVALFFMFRGGPEHAYITEYPDGPVDLSKMIESGKTNIVDLYSEFCPPCRAIAPYLEKLAKARTDVNVIRIDINRKGHRGIDWQSPIARQFNLRSIPHFILVNGDGKVLEEGRPAYKKVVEMIQKTLHE